MSLDLKMRIAYMSDSNLRGQVVLNEINLHTDIAWMKAYALTSFHLSEETVEKEIERIDEHYDFLFINYPKERNGEMNKLIPNIISRIKKVKVGLIQHGGYDYFMTWNTKTQNNYIKNIKNSDFFVYTNLNDYNAFKLLAGDIPLIYMPTTLDDAIVNHLNTNNKTDKVIIGGNMTPWYAGTFSLLASDKLNVPITIPYMGRRQHDEKEHVQNIVKNNVEFLEFMPWFEWFKLLSTHKYAVTFMPVAACGSFIVACAALGIPCLGREHITAQKECFPDLCINDNFDDIEKKIELMKTDYDRISKYARKMFLKKFEDVETKKILYKQLNDIR